MEGGKDEDKERTRTTSFLSQQPTCGWMHSWQGGGVISTMMTTTTTDDDSDNGDDDDLFDKDDYKDPNGGERKDNAKQQPIFL